MTARELLALYTQDVINLDALLNKDPEADERAYGLYSRARFIAWEGARKAAAAYVKEHDDPEEVKKRRAANARKREQRIASIWEDGFRAAKSSIFASDEEYRHARDLYARTVMRGSK